MEKIVQTILHPLKKIMGSRFLPHEVLVLKHRLYEFLGRRPTVVYTMGKVGSSTVFHSFQKQYNFPLIYHVHHLSDESFQRTMEKYRNNNLDISGKVNLFTLIKGSSSHMSASQILRRSEIKDSSRKWNIITMVRDPFSTYLSHIFQNPQIFRPFLLNDDGILDKDKVQRHIYDIFTNPSPEKDFITEWFDQEFFGFTGVDIYQYPFDPQKGYSIIREKKFNIAIMSLETLDENLPIVFKKFSGSDKDISIKKKNVRNKNDKSGFYKSLKQNISVPREGLKEFYSTKYANHFFSEEFRNQMINRWTENEKDKRPLSGYAEN